MITNEQDRKALIAYRLKQANDSIEIVDFLINNKQLTIAVNRIYYGMYYALTALGLQHKFETSKHSQLIGWFNKEFIKSNKVDSSYGMALRNAFGNRTKGDYDAFVEFTLQDVQQMHAEMRDFIIIASKLISEAQA